jgi:recombination associated protein RdgC
MAQWLLAESTDEWPSGLFVERECELQSHDEEKSVVRYTRHHLLNDEVRQHLQRGLQPKRLAMSWEGRVAFVLTESMQLKKIGFLDGVIAESGQDESGFDADVAISTGELRQLIPDLIEALGGELIPGAAPVNIAA